MPVVEEPPYVTVMRLHLGQQHGERHGEGRGTSWRLRNALCVCVRAYVSLCVCVFVCVSVSVCVLYM